jgi:hypothetical protein
MRRTWPVVGVLLVIFLAASGCGDDDQAADDDVGTAVSQAIEESGIDDLECLLPDAVVAEAVGEDVTGSGGAAGGSGGSAGSLEFSISYVGCDYTLASGGEVTVAKLVDTDDATAVESYEQVAALVGVDDDAVAVDDLGDDAVQNDEDLLLLVGDRAFYVEGETEAGDDIDPAVLQAVGAAIVAEVT